MKDFEVDLKFACNTKVQIKQDIANEISKSVDTKIDQKMVQYDRIS